MNRHLQHSLLAALLISSASAWSAGIDRIEPPHWWVGMRDTRLELMAHAPDIATAKARLRGAPAGVRLKGSSRLDSENYLFVDLDIGKAARPGTLTLDFVGTDGKTVASQAYELRARAPGSAQRQGFDGRDAIYLVVPDRFANGDPANDNAGGLSDPANRANPDGRHGGDIQGMVDKLDYIAGLGFTQLWPTPLVENRQPEYSYHGYSPTDLYKIDPRFGTNDDYRALVAKARAKGLGVIHDIVPNHIGSGHWWMQDMPSKDWVNQHEKYTETNHRHVTQVSPYTAPSDRERFAAGWFVPTMPDLNGRQPKLERYLIQNALWWVEDAGLSGLRVDTYPYSDKSFLSRWSGAVMREYPRLTLVGEEMSNNPLMLNYWLAGPPKHDGYVSHMPSMMDFPLHYWLREALLEPEGQGYGSGWGKVYEALTNDALYPEPTRMVLFEGNHDTNRIYSALGEDAALNRLAVTFIATTARTPQFFYGSEILMKSPVERADGPTRADFPGGWAGDAVDAVSGRGLSEVQRDAQAYLRRLLNWRKTAAAIHRGKLMHYDPLGGVYVYFRYTDTQKVMVVLSKNTAATELDTRRFSDMLTPRSVGRDVITGQRLALGRSLTLPARSALVLEVTEP
ncbi:MAG TPA: glycoside hydrolase family 13 protein [Roseateles sp.]